MLKAGIPKSMQVSGIYSWQSIYSATSIYVRGDDERACYTRLDSVKDHYREEGDLSCQPFGFRTFLWHVN